jgi:hypothetical protein
MITNCYLRELMRDLEAIGNGILVFFKAIFWLVAGALAGIIMIPFLRLGIVLFKKIRGGSNSRSSIMLPGASISINVLVIGYLFTWISHYPFLSIDMFQKIRPGVLIPVLLGTNLLAWMINIIREGRPKGVHWIQD